jgi:hypothetical protein
MDITSIASCLAMESWHAGILLRLKFHDNLCMVSGYDVLDYIVISEIYYQTRNPLCELAVASDGCGKMLRAKVICVSCAANLRDRIV